MPKISVITITCREKPNLDKMAQCLMNQTFKDFEWIIVDRKIRNRSESFYAFINAITHHTFPVSVVEPKYSIYHDFNMPAISNARNSGLMAAEGELVVWLDDNLWFKPDHLQRHWNAYQFGKESGKKYYMVGLSWPFPDWATVSELAKKEPFDLDSKFCREGGWFENNPGAVDGSPVVNLVDDNRAYQTYPWPDGKGAVLITNNGVTYEQITGAWCYGRNMSMPLEASLDINGNDERYDGTPDSQDMDYGLRLNNYGFITLLDRNCVVYKYRGEDNINLIKALPFLWGHIQSVNGTLANRNQFNLWQVMREPNRVTANWFDLKKLRANYKSKGKML